MGLPLNEILTSILREFEKANLSIDVSREYWRNIYKNNSFLKEYPPSKIRILEATISLPLAVESISVKTEIENEFTKSMLRHILAKYSEVEDREKVIDSVFEPLQRGLNYKLSNRNLTVNLRKQLLNNIEDSVLEKVIQEIKHIQNESKKLSRIDSEMKFLFQTDEIEKISSDKIVKFDFKIGVD